MPREMFGDVVNPSIKVGSRPWYSVPLSIIAHVLILGAIIVIPLMAADVLPTPQAAMSAFVAAAPPPPPPPPPPSGGVDRLEALKQLGELKAQGVLTDAEFESEKARILAG